MSSVKNVLQPKGVAPASVWSVLIATAVLGLGGVLIRDGAVLLGWLAGRPWIADAIGRVDSLSASNGTLIVSIALITLGIIAIIIAALPQPVKGFALDEGGHVWLEFSGAESLANSAASDVDSVVNSSSSASRKRIDVTATTLIAQGGDARQAVTSAVNDALSALHDKPTVAVKTVAQ